MLRTLLTAISCLLLAGCWMSEERLLTDGDWAHLQIDGSYKSVDSDGDEEASVVLKTNANGLIEGTRTDLENGETERVGLGLAPIAGGSGRYFLAVDRSDTTRTDGDIYLIAHLAEQGALEFYWPDCEGTSPTDGMAAQKDTLTDSTVCTFATKAGLMRAALEAERFLYAKHVIGVAPLGRMVPDDGSGEAEDDDSGERAGKAPTP